MTSKTHPPVPAEFQALARHCDQFSQAVQSLVYADDRGTVLAAEATRFARLSGAAVQALARPPTKGMPVGSLPELARDIGPAIDLLGDLIAGFRRNSAAGVAVLPHQNDLQIGMEL